MPEILIETKSLKLEWLTASLSWNLSCPGREPLRHNQQLPPPWHTRRLPQFAANALSSLVLLRGNVCSLFLHPGRRIGLTYHSGLACSLAPVVCWALISSGVSVMFERHQLWLPHVAFCTCSKKWEFSQSCYNSQQTFWDFPGIECFKRFSNIPQNKNRTHTKNPTLWCVWRKTKPAYSFLPFSIVSGIF